VCDKIIGYMQQKQVRYLLTETILGRLYISNIEGAEDVKKIVIW
jgi:hypothetical protein